ncbi:hypothetical protein H4I95_09411 [Botrytis cinerea]
MSKRSRRSRASPPPRSSRGSRGSRAPLQSELSPTPGLLQDIWEWDTDLSAEENDNKSMEFTTAHNSACYQYQAWVDKVRVDAGMKRELAISFPKGVPPLRAYFHPVWVGGEPGPPRMGDMISINPEFDDESIPPLTETSYTNVYYGRDPIEQAMVPHRLPAVATPASLRDQIQLAFKSLPQHTALHSLKDYVAPFIPQKSFDQVCHRSFSELTIDELQGDLVPFDGNYDWMFRWPDLFSELFLLQNTLWERDFIKSQENCQVCWIIKYYRENPHEVPESCRASVIAEARKRGEIPQLTTQASGSRYQDNPTRFDEGSTSGHGADNYGQSTYQPSGSGNDFYRGDQNSVYNTSGTYGYQSSEYNQYSSQPSGSRYLGDQQYDHGDLSADVPYSDVNTSEPNIITAEPRHQERTPAPRDNRASGSRPSRKGKEPRHHKRR